MALLDRLRPGPTRRRRGRPGSPAPTVPAGSGGPHPARVVVAVKRSVGGPLVDAFGTAPGVEVLRISARGARRGRALWVHRWRESAQVVRASASAEAVVVVNAGSEVLLVAAMLRMRPWRRRLRLVVADFLPSPYRRWDRLQAVVLGRVDAWVCIRTGDVATMRRRFRVPPERCSFARWPLSFDPSAALDLDAADVDGPYLYCAGKAHRDWDTVVEALHREPRPAVLSMGPGPRTAGGSTTPPLAAVIGAVDPDAGRALAARAVLVVVALLETDLPAGPTVLTDALALGAPVVASDTNGTRDYVLDGVTARLVPPGDPDALAVAIAEVWDDPDLAERLGRAGSAWARAELDPRPFVDHVLQRCAR